MYLHDNGCICPRPQIVPRGGGGQEPEMKVTMMMMIMIVIIMVIMMMMKVTGGPIIYARAGSAVTLECAVSGLAAAPAVLRWTRSGEDDLSATACRWTRSAPRAPHVSPSTCGARS